MPGQVPFLDRLPWPLIVLLGLIVAGSMILGQPRHRRSLKWLPTMFGGLFLLLAGGLTFGSALVSGIAIVALAAIEVMGFVLLSRHEGRLWVRGRHRGE